jgi:phage terminase large subunit-like protein
MPSVAEQLATIPPDEAARFIASLPDAEADALLYNWRGFLARPDQIAPDGDWDIWLALAGRGFGKTELGAQWVREQVETNAAGAIALVAETAADARDVMVARLLRIFPKATRPTYTKSNRCVEFHNGAKAWTYNATEPDQLRGPEHDAAWSDEVAKWRYARETWDQLQFGLRLGERPRQIVTTTPRPIELIKAMVGGQEGKCIVTRGRTMDNRANLAASFMEKIQRRYAGTRLGRQELEAEILGDLPGALWAQSVIDSYRVSVAPTLGRIVVAVDPAVTNTEDSDDHGIVVCGMDAEKTGYVIEDASLKGSPVEWARATIAMAKKHEADCVVVEVNQGGDMVAHTLRTIAPNLRIREVRASRGKHVRAEPVASFYEQGRIRHVGQFPFLESQMTQMTTEGYQGDGSPDRVDALVWAFTELFPDMVKPVADASKFAQPRRVGGWMGR